MLKRLDWAAEAISWSTWMIKILRREGIYLWYYLSIQFEQIFGYWVLGLVLGSVISVFFKETIHQRFRSLGERKLGVFGIFAASALGIASPLCMAGTIPIAASFSKSGIQDDWLAAFMMSSMLLNPQLLIYSAALGEIALGIRLGSCFFCGCLAGLLVRFFFREQSFFNFEGFAEPQTKDTDPSLLLRFIRNLSRNLRATGPYFFIGIVLAAFFQRYVPTEGMTMLFAGNEAWGILMAATLGVPLYACGGGTIPLLQAWIQDGMSLGSAAAFMLTGPATKITNLGAVKIVLKQRNFVLYLAYVGVFSFITGFIIQFLGL